MSLSDVDCMNCLVNIARGLVAESQIHWRGVTHAAVYEMGPGHLVAACKYEQHNAYGGYVEWWQRKCW